MNHINLSTFSRMNLLLKSRNVRWLMMYLNTSAIYPAPSRSADSYQLINNIHDQPVNEIERQECQVIDDTFETSILCSASCSHEGNEKLEKRFQCEKLENVIRKQHLKMFEMRKK